MKYTIGDFSRISQLSIKALRLYHEQGILPPTIVDRVTGYRYYDEKALERARTIQRLKDLDFSLKEIKEILDYFSEDTQLVGHLRQKAAQIAERIGRLEKTKEMLRLMIRQEEENINMYHTAEIIIKDVPEMLVAGLRFRGRYQEVGKYLGKLGRHCGRQFRGPVFALYYDGDFKEDDADIEVGIGVKKAVSAESIQSRHLPGGRAASILHHGPYENISYSYKKIIDFIQQSKFQVRLPSREIYLKGPGVIFYGNPKKFITEIQMFIDTEQDPTPAKEDS